MGWYSTYIFPRLMDRVMRGPDFQRLRADLLQSAQGTVLEVGLGTGLNVPHYPVRVTRLQAVEPALMLPQRLAERCEAAAFPIDITRTSAESLPYPDHAFDCAVSTWTLCTIVDPVRALREVRRVLKPEGRFLFLEHGRSEDASIATWQDRLNPIQNVIGCGCHLNRRIDRLIAEAGLHLVQLNRFVMEGVPRVGGELYRGVAVPPRNSGVKAPSKTAVR